MNFSLCVQFPGEYGVEEPDGRVKKRHTPTGSSFSSGPSCLDFPDLGCYKEIYFNKTDKNK